jgi:hypothetical protein
MGLKAGELAKVMLGAAKGKLTAHWPDIREYAKAEAKKTAETLVMIERLKLTGDINVAQAKALLRMQRASAQSVLMCVEGLGLLMAEAAINAALGAVKDTVNGALDFALL